MQTFKRWVVAAAVLAMVPIVVTTVSPTTVFADAVLGLTKEAPVRVLAGKPIPYTLTASNSGDQPAYNISFRDVLPVGAEYTGTTSPASAGEPTIYTNLVGGVPQQTLVWENVTDLQVDDDFTLSFTVDLDPGSPPSPPRYVVGSTVTNDATVYGSTDPRVVQRFGPTGLPLPLPPSVPEGTVLSDADSAPTTLTAIEITKAEPSPEGELLRGVHENVTTYTLTIEVTEQGGVGSVVVTDLLSAELEFLGCNDVDNTSGDVREYPDAPRLGQAPIDPCDFPDLVETVQIPPGGAVFTRLTWDLGSLTAGQTIELNYAAGIPLRANEMFAATPTPPPTPGSGLQASNLDNNTGASTRELIDEGAVTNVARADGVYGATSVFDEDRLSRDIEDVRMRKRIIDPAAPHEFRTGELATYEVVIDRSEYVSASDIVVTDRVPNGMCPIGEILYSSTEPACGPRAPGDPDLPSVPFESVTPVGDGGFDVVFEPLALTLDPDVTTTTITYKSLMRPAYEGGPLDGGSTAAGDSFTNHVGLVADTTPRPGTGEGGTEQVEDDSSATLISGGMSIDKKLMPRQDADGDLILLDPASPAVDRCPEPGTSSEPYLDPSGPPTAATAFRLGDQVCFVLRVDFAQEIHTRNPVITDFFPAGVEYVADSMRATTNSTVGNIGFVEPTDLTLPLVFQPFDGAAGSPRFVERGNVFEVVFAVEVVDVPDGNLPEVTGNLMKMRTENSDGHAESYRDRVAFAIIPAPPLDLVKGVASVDLPPNGPNGPFSNVDGVAVQEGSEVEFRLDVRNLGTPLNFNNYSVRGLEVWDVLPAQLTCGAVVPGSITPMPAACIPGVLGAPSTIVWNLPESNAIFTADSPDDPKVLTLTYRVTIPAPTSIAERFDNRAGVRQYDAYTNLEDVTAPYFPADNIDPSIPLTDRNAPAADDDSWVYTPDAVVDKAVTTSITETNNNQPNQAVVGEYVQYTYRVDLPAHSTLYNGELVDQLPTPAGTLVLLTSAPYPAGTAAPEARFYPTGSGSFTTTLPTGVVFDPLDGSIDFAPDPLTSYQNATANTQRFEVVIWARVTETGLGATEQPTRTNTARLNATNAAGTSLPTPSGHPREDAANFQIRQPLPSLDKTVSGDDIGVVAGGSTITFTLTASTPADRPPLHDAWLEDCVPEGLLSVTIVGDTTGTINQAGNPATNGCLADETYLAFPLGTLAPGVPAVRTYTAVVSPESVAGATYTNDAVLTGSSLNDGKPSPQAPDNPNERTYEVGDEVTVTVAGATIIKTVTPTSATIGESVDYTVRIVVPADTNFYQGAVVDRLPLGIVNVRNLQTVCTRLDTDEFCDDSLPGGAVSGTLLGPELDPGDPVDPDDDRNVVAFYTGDVLSRPYDRAVVFTYTGTVADVASNEAGTTLTNVAQTRWDVDDHDDDDVDSPTYPWTNSGNTDDATVTVLEPNVAIAKSVDNATPEPGDTFTYTVAVTNPGANRTAAYDITVVDTVPAGVVVGTISNGGTFAPGTAPIAGTITWDGDDLPGPLCGTRTIGDVTPCVGVTEYALTYQATLAPSGTLADGVTLTNTADVTRYEGLPPTEPDANRRVYDGPSSSATVSPDFPQLTTSKLASGEPTYIGDAYTWTITTTNSGNGTAYAVGVSDDLPPNWTYVAGSAQVTRPSGTTQVEPTTVGCAPNDLCWNGLGNLAPTQQVQIVFQARPTAAVAILPPAGEGPGVGSSVRHINSTSSTATDVTNATGNASGTYGAGPATASTRIDAVDLVMDKSHTDTPVAGSPFRWFLDVRNASTTDTGVGPFTVTDTLPAGVSYVSATGTDWSCGNVAQLVTCTRGGTIAPSGTLDRITVTVTLPSDMPAGTTLTNSATVGGRTYELVPGNNTDIDEIAATAQADLGIVKNRAGDPAPIVAGRTITYTLDVTNYGPSTSRANIVVTDPIPAQTTFVSASGTGWSCPAPVAGLLTCTRTTDLLSGTAASQITVTVLAASNATGTIDNEATVTGTTPDPVPGNNTDDADGPVTAVADLRIVKQKTTAVAPGQNATYRLRVDNLGPSDAAATVRITDNLPTGLTFVSATSIVGVWNCPVAVGATAVTCDLVDDLITPDPVPLPFGAHATVDLTVFVASSVQGEIRNTASVASPTTDPNPGNNTDTDVSTFTGSADLTIVKTAPATVNAGAALAWNLVVTNNGPSDSVGTALDPIVVTDVLPDSVRFVSTAVTGAWTCAHDGALVGGVVTCDYAATIPGIPAPPAPPTPSSAPAIVINTTVLVDAGPATIVNMADVDGVTPDPDLDNNDDDAQVVVTDLTDLTIQKSADPTTLNAGETTDFTFVVTNAGPSMADNVIVSDNLPAGLTVDTITVDPAEWTCIDLVTSFTCHRPALLPGVTPPIAPPIVVTVLVDSGVPNGTTIVNVGSVSTASPESNLNNNTDDAVIDINALADLGVTKTHEPEPATAGTDVEFTVTVTNNGPSDAIAPVVVVDTLPPGFLYRSHSGPWDCNAPVPADPADSQIVTCTYDAGAGPLPLPASVTPDPIVMTVAIDLSASPTGLGQSYVNHASVSSPTPDDNPDNDDVDDPVTVVASADLAIVKTHPAARVRVGDPTTFTLQVTNNGPSTAVDVVVTDTLPAGLTYVSHQATGWTCAASSPTISCALNGDLLPGAAPPINVTATVTAAAYPQVVNSAEVSSTTPDPVDPNNTTTDPVVVPPQVDLAIVKTHDGGTVRVGNTIGYTLRVTNNGPTSDPGPVTITDTLPGALKPITASGPGLTCNIAGQTITCVSAAPLAVGATRTVAVTATVLPEAYPSVTNTATVATPSEETSTTNNSSTVVTPVEPLVQLALTKSLESQLGTFAVWAFRVENLGPNATVLPVVVTDPLPAGLVYVGASGDGWICEDAANVIHCTYAASLAAGAAAPLLRIQTMITAPAGTLIQNVASATGGGPETTEVTSQATVTTPIPTLPITGSDAMMLARIAAVFALFGLALWLSARRQRSTPTPV